MEKKKIQIHKVLPELLKKKNVSIREVSRKTSVPQATLNSWTKDGSKPSDVNSLKLVASYFQISMDYLLYAESVQDFENIETDVLLNGLFRIRLEKVKEK